MKIMGMRWGYDGGGICCGPVDGSVVVEVEFTDGNETRYAVISRYAQFEKTLITENSRFEQLIDQDFDEGFNDERVLEQYDYELCDIDEDFFASKYFPVINIARSAMGAYEGEYDDDEELADKAAAEFIKPFMDCELTGKELPVVTDYGIYGEDEEEDE